MAECLYVGGREPSSSNCCFSQTPDLLDLSDRSPCTRPAWSQAGGACLRASFLPSAASWLSRRLCRLRVVLPRDFICCRWGGDLGRRELLESLGLGPGSAVRLPPAWSSGPARRWGGTRLAPAQLAAQSCRLDSRVAASSLSAAAQRSHVLSVHSEQGVPSEQEVYVRLAPRHSLPDCQDAPSKRFISMSRAECRESCACVCVRAGEVG